MFQGRRLARMIARDMDANPDKWAFIGHLDDVVTDGKVQLKIDDYYGTATIITPFRARVSRRIAKRAVARLQERRLKVALTRTLCLTAPELLAGLLLACPPDMEQ